MAGLGEEVERGAAVGKVSARLLQAWGKGSGEPSPDSNGDGTADSLVPTCLGSGGVGESEVVDCRLSSLWRTLGRQVSFSLGPQFPRARQVGLAAVPSVSGARSRMPVPGLGERG